MIYLLGTMPGSNHLLEVWRTGTNYDSNFQEKLIVCSRIVIHYTIDELSDFNVTRERIILLGPNK
tara:strand:+ start:34 stop:228 length:195 start_codon:yes stop_codon:yes gene_type:complete